MTVERIELAPGYSISRIINGGWQLSDGHGATAIDREGGFDREGVLESLLRLIESGFTTFDCADIYTGVEELYGEMLRRYRRRTGDQELAGVQIHTKCVPDLADLPTLRKRDLERIVDRSLFRLGVERLDLVQFHWWDYAIPGCVEAAGWLAELRRAGKIRLLGATNFDSVRLQEMLAAGVELVSVQVQYSLLDQRPEGSMAASCAEHGISLLCYGSLAGGFLSEKFSGVDEPEPANRSQTKYRLVIEEAGGWRAFQGLLSELGEIARRHGCSLSNIAARWVLDQPQVAAAIVGAPDDAHRRDNLRVATLRLDSDDHRRLAAALHLLRPLHGDPFALEREPGGRHQKILKTGLNRAPRA